MVRKNIIRMPVNCLSVVSTCASPARTVCPAYIFSPSPSQITLNHRTSYNRPQNRPSNHGHGITNNGRASLLGRPDIPQNTPGVGHRCRAEEPGEETGDHDGLQVFGSGCAEGEDGCDKIGRQHCWFAAVDFG